MNRGNGESNARRAPASHDESVYNSEPMSEPSRLRVFAPLWLGLTLAAGLLATGGAPAQQLDRELLAHARVFPEIGPGLRALRRGPSGRYYILAAPNKYVAIYGADGKPAGQAPPAGAPSLVYGEDMDLDAAGRVYVADRGANAVKIFDASGHLASTISIPAPSSVAALPAGEVAVASLQSRQLVAVFDEHGKVVREFGDLSDLTDRADLNRFLNVGRLATDAASHIYYAFTYLPEPTVRKYDRFGYAAFEVSLSTPEFAPRAQALRREIFRLTEERVLPVLKPVVNAIGVEPETQQLWVALGDELLLFDRDGNRRRSYRTFTPEGARLEPVAILVEPDRLLLAADPLGIFEFPRPDKTPATPAPAAKP
jgi:hypothetical protein